LLSIESKKGLNRTPRELITSHQGGGCQSPKTYPLNPNPIYRGTGIRGFQPTGLHNTSQYTGHTTQVTNHWSNWPAGPSFIHKLQKNRPAGPFFIHRLQKIRPRGHPLYPHFKEIALRGHSLYIDFKNFARGAILYTHTSKNSPCGAILYT
jgi:hypothetical protein